MEGEPKGKHDSLRERERAAAQRAEAMTQWGEEVAVWRAAQGAAGSGRGKQRK